ncbi:MAG TPA: hypothetical protein VMF65_22040 [Acidimicrobiales bacterium]|nr:hypothetical protein [Acidimicrobiales bacterium]
MLIEVEPGGLSGTAPAIGSIASSLLSSVGSVSSACESAAGAAGHAAVQAAIEGFLAAGAPALSNLSALEQATSSRLDQAAGSYVSNDNSVMGG